MEFIQSERGNQKLNIKLKKNCGGQLSGGLLSCSHSEHMNYTSDHISSSIKCVRTIHQCVLYTHKNGI